jgi:hypothetical protein
VEPARSQGELTGVRQLVLPALAMAMAMAMVACGGSRKPAPKPAAPQPSAKERACRAYNANISPFLGRFDGALGALRTQKDEAGDDTTARADAVGRFAEFLVGEIEELRAIESRDEQLGQAHRYLVVAIEQVSLGHEQLATAYAIGDTGVRRRALDRLARAWTVWPEASRAIVSRCSGEQAES